MAKGPTIIIKSRPGGYYSKERVNRILKEGTEEDVAREVPLSVWESYLDRDFTNNSAEREICKRNFRKIPTEAIRRASGGKPEEPTDE